MQFNIPMAMQMTATLTLFVALVLAYSARQFPRAVQQPMRLWIAGLGVQSMPYFLYSTREFAPEWACVVLADCLMLVALSMQIHALRRFNLQSDRRFLLQLVVAATIIGELLLTYVWYFPRGRIVLVSMAIAVVSGFGVDAMYRRRVVTRAENMVGMLLFATIAVMLLRAAIVPATSMLDLTTSSPMQGVVLNFAASIPVISTVVFVLMCGERVNDHFSQKAMIDPLTGVYTRKTMKTLADKAIETASRHRQPLTLLSVDIDRFGDFNEDFGYDVGDTAICHVLDSVRETMRSNDVLARVAGEQFVVLLADTDESTAFELACRMRRRVEESGFASDGWPATLQVSIGVASIDMETADFNALLRKANRSLATAKGAGRNRVASATRLETPDTSEVETNPKIR